MKRGRERDSPNLGISLKNPNKEHKILIKVYIGNGMYGILKRKCLEEIALSFTARRLLPPLFSASFSPREGSSCLSWG